MSARLGSKARSASERPAHARLSLLARRSVSNRRWELFRRSWPQRRSESGRLDGFQFDAPFAEPESSRRSSPDRRSLSRLRSGASRRSSPDRRSTSPPMFIYPLLRAMIAAPYGGAAIPRHAIILAQNQRKTLACKPLPSAYCHLFFQYPTGRLHVFGRRRRGAGRADSPQGFLPVRWARGEFKARHFQRFNPGLGVGGAACG